MTDAQGEFFTTPPTPRYEALIANDRDPFVVALSVVAEECHHISASKGFWPEQLSDEDVLKWVRDTTPRQELKHEAVNDRLLEIIRKARATAPRNEAELVALEHSELSELLEAQRKGNPADSKLPMFSSEEIEMADTIIRCLDHSAAKGYRIGEAILAKMGYNRARPPKHGKKF